MPRNVFISHSSKDGEIARAVCAALEGSGISCWIAPRDIPPGEEWDVAIMDGIEGSSAMVLIWTSRSNESEDVALEVKHARRKALPVVPFRTEQFAPNRRLEYYLTFIHWLDATAAPLEQHLPQLIQRVGDALEEYAREQEERARRQKEEEERHARVAIEEQERAEREAHAQAERDARARAQVAAQLEAEHEAKRRARAEEWRRALELRKKRRDRSPWAPLKEHQVREYFTELIIPDGSPLIGQTLAESAMADGLGVVVNGIFRGQRGRIAPRSEERLEAGDVLLVQAHARDILDLMSEVDVVLEPAFRFYDDDLIGQEPEFLEGMVLRGSDLNGRTLRGLNFRDRYGLTVLAISRHGVALLSKLSSVTLRFGDVLLMTGRRESFERMAAEGILMFLEDEPPPPPWWRFWKSQRPRRGRPGYLKLLASVLLVWTVSFVAFFGLSAFTFYAVLGAGILTTYLYARLGRT